MRQKRERTHVLRTSVLGRKVLNGLVALPSREPKLLDRLREALRSRHYSQRTEKTYFNWIKRFIYFHNFRHPAKMAESEINAYLTHLTVKEKVSASTQNQALSVLLFLYRHVLNKGGHGVQSPVDGL